MRAYIFGALAVSAFTLAYGHIRADGLPSAGYGPPPYTWSGLYIGAHMGAALDESSVSDPFVDPILGTQHIFGDSVRSTGGFVGGKIGFNHQVGGTVVGLEADINWADLEGTNTCFAAGTFFLAATCQEHTDAFGTLAGRLGWVVGSQGRTLLYGKGGLAWIHKDVEIAMNNPFTNTTNSSLTQWGWTVGGGVEYKLSGRWSATLEYDFLSFANHDVATPNPGVLPFAPDGRNVGLGEDVHTVRLGINYKPNGYDTPWAPDVPGSLQDAPGRIMSTGYAIDVGARYVHGWGRFQKDLAATATPSNTLISRLTYDGKQTDGGELYGRIDTPINLMLKGLVGLGSGRNGHLNDEDFGLGGALGLYSNTLSAPVDDRIRYGTIDAGYDWLRGSGYKVASFVGYNRYSSDMSAFGCQSIAAFNCTPPVPATGSAIITEHDTWQALRLGTAVDFMLLPRVMVSADAAYLPTVHFDGTDTHFFGNTGIVNRFFPEAGNGQGAQLEGSISYFVTDRFSVGVGARYWAAWTTSGHDSVTFVNPPIGTAGPFPSQYKTEQAAAFVQGSYKLP